MSPRSMVTGASAGIGAAFAERLAERGSDLVLVARSGKRLQKLARDLSDRFSVAVETIEADLTDAGQLEVVARRLEDGERPVELLINNAGVGYLGYFIELPVQGEQLLVRLNVEAVVRLSHAAARQMSTRGSGGIVIVSSIDAHMPIPLLATYAASKAFASSFGLALHEELRPKGVIVTVVEPGVIDTEFFDHSDFSTAWVPSVLIRRPAEVVDAALGAHFAGRPRVVPSLLYRVVVATTELSPNIARRRLSHALMRRSHSTR